MAGLSITGLTKRYRGAANPALSALTLSVPAGGRLAVVGPSGSGKSTLLRLLSGLELPDAGSIRLGDHDLTNVPAGERDVAMVFQNYALFPHMTVFENLTFGMKARGVGKTERTAQANAVAKRLGLTPHLEKKPSQLSGGEQQ